MSAVPIPRASLLATMAAKFNVDPSKLLTTLKGTAFRGNVTDEQMIALLVVANHYGLNPFTRELFAFPDKQNGIVPVVSVDGWSRILNDHPQFDGLKFDWPEGLSDAEIPAWCDCTIFRKDRTQHHPIREWFKEVRRDTGPWKSHPRRMLRHKALIQAARVTLGFSGIYDEDEAQRIAAGDVTLVDVPPQASRTEQAKALLSAKPAEEPLVLVDTDTGEVFDAEASREMDKADG